MRICVSTHIYVSGKIHDVVYVIDGIIYLATWPTPGLRTAISSSTTRPSLILLLLRWTNESLGIVCSCYDTITRFGIPRQQNPAPLNGKYNAADKTQ